MFEALSCIDPYRHAKVWSWAGTLFAPALLSTASFQAFLLSNSIRSNTNHLVTAALGASAISTTAFTLGALALLRLQKQRYTAIFTTNFIAMGSILLCQSMQSFRALHAIDADHLDQHVGDSAGGSSGVILASSAVVIFLWRYWHNCRGKDHLLVGETLGDFDLFSGRRRGYNEITGAILSR